MGSVIFISSTQGTKLTYIPGETPLALMKDVLSTQPEHVPGLHLTFILSLVQTELEPTRTTESHKKQQ